MHPFKAAPATRHLQESATSVAVVVACRPVRRLPFLTLSAFLCLCAPALQAAEMMPGSAIVTSRSGPVRASEAGGRQLDVDTHDILLPSGLSLSTGKKGRIFLALSNGVAVALDEATSIFCAEYTQRPFSLEDQSRGLEPSESGMRLQLESGQIAIATNRLSPLSELRILLPHGELRLHKGTCLINYDSMGLRITSFDGNLTYYYPDSDAREYVSAPASVRISDQSAERRQATEVASVDSLGPEDIQLCRAAQHASQRVTFEANITTGLPPVPVLIVKPQYFQQPAMRPYQFKD